MKVIRRAFFLIDDIIHIAVAILLIFSACFFLYEAGTKLFSLKTASVLEMIGDLLFVLLIMEILWDVLRYLKRQVFTLKPFIYIGIISSVRGMILVEAKIGLEPLEGFALFQQLAKIGIFSLIVLVLIICLYILGKIPQQKDTEG